MSTYRVVFSGKALPGFNKDTAVANLAKLLKRTPEQAAAAFNGKDIAIKKGISEADAERLCQTLERAGLQVHAEPESGAPAPAAPAAPSRPGMTAPTSARVAPADLSLVDYEEEKKPDAPKKAMVCPACGQQQPEAEVCNACGMVIAKFLQRQAQKAKESASKAKGAASPYEPGDASPARAEEDGTTALPELFAFNVAGRIGRLRMLAWNLMTLLVVFAAGLIAALLSLAGPLAILLLLPLFGVALFFAIRITVLRLHDRGHTGWLAALIVVPLVNIALGLYLLFAPGNSEANDYGPPPPPNTTGVIAGAVAYIVATILPMFFVPGLLTAMAMQSAMNDPSANAEFEQELQRAMEEAAAEEQSWQDGDAGAENSEAGAVSVEETAAAETAAEESVDGDDALQGTPAHDVP
ncbi:MAG: DUF805 domain-containing protein [Pseudomonadota bacterium]